MIRDLATSPSQEIETDVLIVGAGIAGLLMATRLSARGVKVLVLESGGHEQTSETHPLNEAVQHGQAYQGADKGRFRCLGGTSTRWGGAMLPFLPEDMHQAPQGWDADWGTADYRALMTYLPDIEELFGLPRDDYAAAGAPQLTDFIPRLAKWPPFSSRNVATLLRAEINSASGPIVWLNATAVKLELDEASRLRKVMAKGPNGVELIVVAKKTALAAGAIECTRLLLLLDAAYDRKIFAPDDVLGRYFHDHLSAPVADLLPRDRPALNRLVGFRFEGRAMRSLRYELSPSARARDGLPAAFAHIAFVTGDDTPFAAMRSLFRKVQQRSLPSARDLAQLAAGSGWLARASWWRFAERRLLAPADARFEMHLVTEQIPRPGNRITLSKDRRDQFGVALPAIDWRVDADDLDLHRRIFALLMRDWRASMLAGLAEAAERPEREIAEALSSCGGVYHPGGSARIGASPKSGVLDGDLKVFRVPDLRVVSTAAFPTGGTANPTLMLMAFACRAADQMRAELAVPDSSQ